MRDRRNALLWAVAWWFGRRWLRRRTARAVAGIRGGAEPRGRIRSVVGGLLLVGALAAAFVVWRRLAGGDAVESWERDDPVSPPKEAPGAVPA
jgi:hypothetical protein